MWLLLHMYALIFLLLAQNQLWQRMQAARGLKSLWGALLIIAAVIQVLVMFDLLRRFGMGSPYAEALIVSIASLFLSRLAFISGALRWLIR